MDINLSKLQEMVKDREAWQSMGSQRVGHDWQLNNKYTHTCIQTHICMYIHIFLVVKENNLLKDYYYYYLQVLSLECETNTKTGMHTKHLEFVKLIFLCVFLRVLGKKKKKKIK